MTDIRLEAEEEARKIKFPKVGFNCMCDVRCYHEMGLRKDIATVIEKYKREIEALKSHAKELAAETARDCVTILDECGLLVGAAKNDIREKYNLEG